MGYYFNHLDNRWQPIEHGRKLSRKQQQEIERRSRLIETLITEIELSNDAIISLYAGLLARTLTATDEILVREHSQRLAELDTPD